MKATILDAREEDRGTCYLCTVSLQDYVENLPREYGDYNVQRGYVTNSYLDALVDTVIRGRYIPPIVLVANRQTKGGSSKTLIVQDFKILDGLQRTFRLHAIWETIKIVSEVYASEGSRIHTLNRLELLRMFSKKLEAAESSISILIPLLAYAEEKGIKHLRALLLNNRQWFEIWTGLSAANEVNMMLMLNAGHKPVALRHQLELLFINVLPRIQRQLGDGFRLVREREQSATRFAKDREAGDFHFAHILSALLSFSEGAPITPSADLMNALQSEEERRRYESMFQQSNLKDFLDFLITLDELLTKQYGQIGTTWMGREVFLTGVLGAVGRYGRDNDELAKDVMSRLLSVLRTHKSVLQLERLETQRNRLDLSKVNIGNANKKAIFQATTQLLSDEVPKRGIDWQSLLEKA